MSKIAIEFKKNIFIKFYAEAVFDGEKSIKIANGNCKSIELAEGVHEVEISVPYNDNQTYMASANININPNMNYKMEYHLSDFANNGVLTVKEMSADNMQSNSGTVITKTKMNINYTKILAIILVVIALAFGVNLIFSPLSDEKIKTPIWENEDFLDENLGENLGENSGESTDENPTEWGKENIVVNTVNTPTTSGNFKIMVTEINATNSDIDIKLSLENIMKHNVEFSDRDVKVYIDGVERDGEFGRHVDNVGNVDELFNGSIASNKRMEGYYVVGTIKEDKKIEFVVQTDTIGRKCVTFSFDIAQIKQID